MGFKHGSAKKCGNSKPSFDVTFQHGPRIFRILARVSQPGCRYGQPRPRRVCVCDAQCCRENRHVHGGPGNPSLSDPNVAARWSFLAVCTSETASLCASMLVHCSHFFLFGNEVGFCDVFFTFSRFRVFAGEARTRASLWLLNQQVDRAV